MKKVLFITTRLINPVNSGTKVVLYNYCKGLKEEFDCEIYQFSFYEEEQDKDIEQPDFIKEIKFAEEPKMIEKCLNLAEKSVILKKWPLQVSLYYSKNTKKELEKYIEKVQPDYIICDMIRTAEYLRNIQYTKAVKILEMQDVLSKRYARQVKFIENNSSAFGAYGEKIPRIVRKVLKSKNVVKLIFEIEKNLLIKYEECVCRDFEKIILVSPKETIELNKRLKIDKCVSIPLGVDYEYFSEPIEVKKDKNLIGFIGNMNIAHNKDAINNFINNCFNNIIEIDKEVQLRIIGKCSKEYKLQFSDNHNIEVTGEVDDIRKYSKECSIIIAPLIYGSGIKTKVLEAMAMGIPVITNDIGAEGLEVNDNEHIIIANDAEKLKNEILKTLNDEAMQDYIAERGQKYIRDNFTWSISIPKFESIIK